MTHQTPKAFDFGEEPQTPPAPVDGPDLPRAFDFGDAQDAAAAAPAQDSPPRALSFDALPPVPAGAAPTAKAAPGALFDCEDHPAVRDALAIAGSDYPESFAHAEQRLAALFRRILPLRLALVTAWAEQPLMEQAALLQPVTELVLSFTRMAVPALLDAALESTRAPAGVFDKLFRRATPPAGYKPALSASREQLLQLLADSEVAVRKLEDSAQNLGLHLLVLAVVSKLAGSSLDATLLDALAQRRALIQQAQRQAELSIRQMEQVRRQAADLIAQISSFLTVTLPALEMAQARGGN